MKKLVLYFFIVLNGVVFSQSKTFTKEDTLLGSNTAYRSWWDVKSYIITVKPDYKTKSISGDNIIAYTVVSDSLPFIMQIDLQSPLQVDSVFLDKVKFSNYKKENNRWMMSLSTQKKNTDHTIQLFYHGMPKVAVNPPWDGGFVWKKDSLGNPWMSVACQGTGASVWFTCKNLQSDEPENGAIMKIIVPDTLVAIGNGKLISQQKNDDETKSYTWKVNNPINSYNIIPYIGKYTLLHDSVEGVKGKLITDYWVLNYHKQKALQHLKPNVTKTIKCFEHWFGPYPFYEDSYKIVEAPYLGMEHQSNIAYGNYFLNGYVGADLSNTGWGLKWDFIVVHESGHEWFGNSITVDDVADNWIHEGFTSYAEVLYTECEFGKEAGNDYCEGVRKTIENDIPIIGNFGVHKEGSIDMYNKGSQIVHMIRQVMNDDEKFRMLLRDLNQTFYHQIVTSKQIEEFISEKTNFNFIPFFNQYLRTIQIPKLEYKIRGNKLSFRYTSCINEFNMPIKITTDKQILINPTTQWQNIFLPNKLKIIFLDRNVYLKLQKVK